MKKMALACVFAALACPVFAEPVLTITDMNCAAVQEAVRSSGSIVLQWRGRGGLPLYSRYVSDRRFCRPGEIISFARVPAADKSCNVKKCAIKFNTHR